MVKYVHSGDFTLEGNCSNADYILWKRVIHIKVAHKDGRVPMRTSITVECNKSLGINME